VLGNKVKFTKCATVIVDETHQWISRAGWKSHMISKAHGRALLHEQQLYQRHSEIERARDADIQEETENAKYVSLNNQLIGSSSLPAASTHVPTAAEEVMWDAFEMGEGNFDAGMVPDEVANRQRIQREMDKFGIWNADRLGGILGADSDEFVLDEVEDEILAETLRNVREYCTSRHF